MKSKQVKLFVTAIGTDSGKTLISAILVKKLEADYWKPIQCGTPTDKNQIETWLGPTTKTIPEQFFLSTPASPHFAAKNENLHVKVSDFILPHTDNNLVVEGAGGLLVPLNSDETIANLILHFDLPVILVVNHYLGSLNHSLLTIEALNQRKIRIAGIVFNGHNFQDAEEIILAKANCPCILRLPEYDKITLELIEELASQMQLNY